MVKINEFHDGEQDDNKLNFSIVHDLHTHMKNDPMFYRKQYYPTMCGCQDKLQKGESIGPEDLMDMINKGVKHYCNKYDLPKRPDDLLAQEEVLSLAEKIYGEEMESMRKGDY